MNNPTVALQEHLTLSRWYPPSYPVRYFSLIGCLEQNDLIQKYMINEGRWWLQKIAVRLFDEANEGDPIGRGFMYEATQQITTADKDLSTAIRTTAVVMTESEAARFLRLSVRSLQRFRIAGGGPTYVRLGARRIRYDLADLEAWISTNRVTSISAEAVSRRGAQ